MIELDPEKVFARFGLGNSLAYKGEFSEAIAQTQRASSFRAIQRYAVILAWIYARSGQIDDVVGSLKMSKERQSGDDQFTGGLGIAAYMQRWVIRTVPFIGWKRTFGSHAVGNLARDR